MQTIIHDLLDERRFKEALKLHPDLNHLVEAAKSKLATSRELIQDIFYSLLRHNPTLANQSASRAYEANQKLISQMMSTLEWRQLRDAGTVSDTFLSAIATFTFAQEMINGLDKQTVKAINQAHELESGAQQLYQQAEVLEMLSQQAHGDAAHELFRQAQQARLDAQQLEQQTPPEVPLDEDKARRIARQAVKESEEQVETTREAIKAFSSEGENYGLGEGTGEASSLTAQEKIELAQRVQSSRRLQEVAALAGRMKRIALNVQKNKTKKEQTEVTSITQGRNISRLLPSELGLLARPALKRNFYAKFSQGKLLQYHLEGKEKQGQGPIILAIDSSGSMNESIDGCGITKETWSKAIMLALLAIARKQKRDMHVIHFSGSYTQLKEYTFLEGKADHLDLLNCTAYFIGGGTHFETWMNKALDRLNENEFKKADVICLSDGISRISSEMETTWNSNRREKEFKCLSVLIGTNQGAKTLGDISDAIMTINNLMEGNDVLQEVFSV